MEAQGPDDDVILTVMVLMTLADDEVAEDEVQRIRWIYEKVVGTPLARSAVRAKLADVRDQALGIDGYLASVLSGVDEARKRRLLKAAFAIASADGRVLDAEDAMLVRIARGLKVTPAVYAGCVTQFAVAREFFTRDA